MPSAIELWFLGGVVLFWVGLALLMRAMLEPARVPMMPTTRRLMKHHGLSGRYEDAAIRASISATAREWNSLAVSLLFPLAMWTSQRIIRALIDPARDTSLMYITLVTLVVMGPIMLATLRFMERYFLRRILERLRGLAVQEGA